jgi:hypothetical protein
VSHEPEQELHAKVLLIVIALTMLLLGIQSWQTSHRSEMVTDEQILATGRRRLLNLFPANARLEISHDEVVRPGLNGGDFGYRARYRQLDADGKWISKEYYDE